jgi:hypothetical protein
VRNPGGVLLFLCFIAFLWPSFWGGCIRCPPPPPLCASKTSLKTTVLNTRLDLTNATSLHQYNPSLYCHFFQTWRMQLRDINLTIHCLSLFSDLTNVTGESTQSIHEPGQKSWWEGRAVKNFVRNFYFRFVQILRGLNMLFKNVICWPKKSKFSSKMPFLREMKPLTKISYRERGYFKPPYSSWTHVWLEDEEVGDLHGRGHGLQTLRRTQDLPIYDCTEDHSFEYKAGLDKCNFLTSI